MKLSLKHIYMGSLIGIGALAMTSCNDFLDRKPITSVTPDAYFTTSDQVGAYVINYYQGQLVNSRGQSMYHTPSWHSGMTVNDDDTDNLFATSGDLDYFGGLKQVPAGKSISSALDRARVWNWFLEQVLPKEAAGTIQGDAALTKHFIGEAYFFRALSYYYALVRYGDFPIVKEVLPDDFPILIERSARAPRNEVARFILQDLDEAIGRLKEQGYADNQRINKQTAQLLKSRVALFEATFEKYHQGTGRVPGDNNWPGKDKSYNQGKTFNIAGEIDFFLTEAMNASKAVVDACPLVESTHQMEPALGEVYNWNPYYEMFGTPDLKGYSEVLLWKKYSLALNAVHDAPRMLEIGGDQLGYTRSFMTSFLMKNGLPYYVSNSGYRGDTRVSMEKEGRDERMQLFVFGEDDAVNTDLADKDVKEKNAVVKVDTLRLISISLETTDMTGYRPRKYFCYEYKQYSEGQACTTGAIVFRASEAYLNYIEACYEKNQSLDANATNYWKALRKRAGVNEDFALTISNTDLNKEADIRGATVFGDLAVYSGDVKIDATLYNIRRERRCELISEGMRWDDLKRWRSWDKIINGRYMVEGMNLWDETYKLYVDKNGKSLIRATGESDANMSSKELSKYVRPMGRTSINNALYEGYTWKKAFYLEPIGIQDMQLTAQDPTDINTTRMYQNPYWPMTAGKALE